MFNNIGYHSLYVQTFLSGIFEHLGYTGFREVYAENAMPLSGNEKSISTLTAPEVKNPAIFLAEIVEKLDNLLERWSTNIATLSV